MKKFFENYKTITIAVSLVLALAVVWFLGLKQLIDSIEIVSYDWRTKISTDEGFFASKFKKADSKVVLLSADDYTAQRMASYPEVGVGRWPWPRKSWADIVNFVSEGKPKAIVFDIKFEGKEGFTPENIASDKALADAIKGKNVILGMAMSYPRGEIAKEIHTIAVKNNIPNDTLDMLVFKSMKQNGSLIPNDFFLNVDDSSISSLKATNHKLTALFDTITFYGHSSIVDSFIKNAMGVGIINLNASENMVARYNVPMYRLVTADGAHYVPSLPLAAVLSVIPESEKNKFKLENNKISFGKREIPVDAQGKLLIGWHGRGGTYKSIPISKVMLSDAYSKGIVKNINDVDKISPDIFKDKIIVIGQTSSGTDIHSTPMQMDYPGPEIVATTIDNYLNDADTSMLQRRKPITKAPVIVDIAVLLIFSAAVGYLNIRSKSVFAGFIWFVLLACLFMFLSVVLFAYPGFRIWLNMTYPIIAMTITVLGASVYRIYKESQEKKMVEGLFGKFVSPQVLKQLLQDPKSISYGGQRKIMTVLFSDIRGFTTMSEKTPPDKVILQLNEYMTEMVEVVLNNEGTLDKYIGDAVMAFYGDPLRMDDHALKAVLTAIDMMKALDKLNEKWKQEGRAVLDIGIGINTGEMVVGHMGSPRLVDYTVIGDNVNLASRLEGMNKEYKTHIIISEATYNDVKDHIDVVSLGECKVKGKEIPIKIYEVKGVKSKVTV